MLDEIIYYEIMDSLSMALKDASDMVNVKTNLYSDYFTSTNKWDSKKNGFNITFIISHAYLSPRKMTHILADTFYKIDNWMEEWEDRLAFLEYYIKPISGENSRIELKFVFDNIIDSAKKLLLR